MNSYHRIGGAEGDRTPDLRIANATLSQLSYGPVPWRRLRAGDSAIYGDAPNLSRKQRIEDRRSEEKPLCRLSSVFASLSAMNELGALTGAAERFGLSCALA